MTTFTRSTKTHNRATDTFTVTETTIEGKAMKVSGNPTRYRELGLIESAAPTLLFAPTTYGDRIEPGDTVTWPPSGGLVYTARDCFHLEPDGVVIQTRVIVDR